MTEQSSGGTDEPLALGDILAQRRRKVAELKVAGVDPFGSRVDDITSSATARTRFAEIEAAAGENAPVLRVRLAGRLTAKREMGKSIFADVRDASGRLQLYVQKSQLAEDAFAAFKALDLGDIVSADGTVFRTRMGEVSLRVECFRLLAKSLRPLPEKWHGLTDTEQRYRQRYLDLISNDGVRQTFERRCRIVRRIRDFLDARGFLEMETPMLQPLPGGAAARPFKTHYAALDCPMYLRIAPELYLKRLLVGGFEKVYEINRNFRNEGLSRRHNPEFTMIEIYQAYGDCRVMMELTEELLTTVARDILGTLVLERADGSSIDLRPPWRRATYAELIRERMGADWFELPADQRRAKARALGLDIPADMPEGDVTHEIYEKIIEATLIQPTFVTRLPAALVPLAKRCADDPDVVDVFELEINGQEIAPGYSELNDPIEQRLRLEAQASAAAGGETAESCRIDEEFLLALEHGMPPAGGMGIGIDRLVMLLTGAESIREVILFPQLRPLRKVDGAED